MNDELIGVEDFETILKSKYDYVSSGILGAFERTFSESKLTLEEWNSLWEEVGPTYALNSFREIFDE